LQTNPNRQELKCNTAKNFMIMATSNKITPKKVSPDTSKQAKNELKTDFPMSEKDEVKKAEERMKKQTKGK
jgi:hypothetical protein